MSNLQSDLDTRYSSSFLFEVMKFIRGWFAIHRRRIDSLPDSSHPWASLSPFTSLWRGQELDSLAPNRVYSVVALSLHWRKAEHCGMRQIGTASCLLTAWNRARIRRNRDVIARLCKRCVFQAPSGSSIEADLSLGRRSSYTPCECSLRRRTATWGRSFSSLEDLRSLAKFLLKGCPASWKS